MGVFRLAVEFAYPGGAGDPTKAPRRERVMTVLFVVRQRSQEFA
jgi:hypothetical protein